MLPNHPHTNGMIAPPPERTTSPIQRLPYDLLHDLFYVVTSSCSHTTQDGSRISGSVLILPISHVCRYWRAIALTSPRLWSFLHITTRSRVAMLREFLIRSQDIPLQVRLRGPKSFWDPTEDIVRMAQILAEHTDRIADFHIGQFFREDMAKVLAFYTDKVALNMRHLTAYSGSYVEIPVLFAGGMPALRSLRLSKVSMPWLPYRDMSEMDIPSQLTPATEDILWTLRHSPSLEMFSLTMYGDVSAAITSDLDTLAGSAIRLPRLRRLQLGTMNDTDDVLRILPHLEFPETTSVALRLRRRLRTHTDIGGLCPSLGAVQAQIRQGFLQLICVDDLYSIVFHSVDAFFSVEWQWGEWRWGADDEADMSSVTNTFDCITLSSLDSLAIHVNRYYLRADQWINMLRHLPTIRSLEIDFRSGQTGSAWGESLPLFNALESGEVNAQLICPRLTNLVPKRVCCDNKASKDAWDRLVRALRIRQGKGAQKLEKLDVQMQTAQDQALMRLHGWLASLEGLVEEVDVGRTPGVRLQRRARSSPWD